MSIVVTGATGHLGRLAIHALLRRGVEPGEVIAAGRNIDRLRAVEADLGVSTAVIDYDDVESLHAAFKGAEQLLLVSGSEIGRRTAQHGNAIAAAAAVGIGLVAYTSAPRAATTSLRLAEEHRATEEILRAGGTPFVVLRNDWYFEVYTDQIPSYRAQGRVVGAAGDGRISAAARADYADAAAAVLTSTGHEGAVYELGGDDAFTMSDLAAELSHRTGEVIPYENVSVPAYTDILVGVGLPRPVAELYADIDRGIAAGELYVDTGDLRRLVGRPLQPLADAIAAALP